MSLKFSKRVKPKSKLIALANIKYRKHDNGCFYIFPIQLFVALQCVNIFIMINFIVYELLHEFYIKSIYMNMTMFEYIYMNHVQL